MKKDLISVALFATLSTMAVSCQKESIVENAGLVESEAVKNKVYYTVDGIMQIAELNDERALEVFFEEMAMLTRMGHRIVVYSNRTCTSVAKETITYTTQSHADAVTWCAKMFLDGYTVTMDYDENTKIYTCKATRD